VMILACLIFILNLFASDNYLYQGIAYDQDNKFLYKETHQEILKDGQIKGTATRYFNQKDQEIGFMINDFTKSLAFPEFHFKNLMTKHEHGVTYQNDGYQMFAFDNGQKTIKDYVPNKQSVTGQGFHFSLVKKIPQLKLNEKGVFDFVIPGRLTSYDFAYEVIEKNEEVVTIKITMNNFLLRLIAPSMQLRYHAKTLRLIDYEGLSNLYEKQKVKIIYEHP
jgi:hypothetical protein